MAKKARQEFFVRCASGFENVLADELRGMGLRQVRPQVSGVAFMGSVRDAYRCCLWSRVATRVQMVLARVEATTADELYAGVSALAWEDLIVEGATVAVRAHGTNAELRNTQFSALRVKDALCDRLRDARGSRPSVDAKDPDFSVDVSVHERKATLYLNLSGASLHRRGYREQGVQTEAPLKETLAAGMLLAAGWDELAREGAAFADPMCGSGTLVLEAALIACDMAPGVLRERWGAFAWKGHRDDLWQELMDEAASRAEAGKNRVRGTKRPLMVGGDLNEQAVGIARANARRAGLKGIVSFSTCDAAQMSTYLGKRIPAYGLLAVNPPYGHRLQSKAELRGTYDALARAVASVPDGWKLALITPDTSIDTALGQAAGQVIACFNGPIRTNIRLYELASQKRTELSVVSVLGEQLKVPVGERNSEQFAARLRKNAKQRLKWARRAKVGCFRVYDADLPDYALSVDLFEGAGTRKDERFLRVAEYPPPAHVDAQRAARRLADAGALAAAVLGVAPENVAVVPGRPVRDAHGRADKSESLRAEVLEAGFAVEADLAGRHGVGFALDQRPVRELLAQLAEERCGATRAARVACLFANAGIATLYAAKAGARTTTVDPSKGFLEVARMAVQRNGFSSKSHRFVCGDVSAWLKQEAHHHASYDLVFCDLPLSLAQDAQDNLNAFVNDACSLLVQGGALVLACASRSLFLDKDHLSERGYELQDVSARTIPHDFERTPKVHCCYLIHQL